MPRSQALKVFKKKGNVEERLEINESNQFLRDGKNQLEKNKFLIKKCMIVGPEVSSHLIWKQWLTTIKNRLDSIFVI